MLKKEQISFRVTPEFKRELKEKALKHDKCFVKLSRYIRYVLKENI